MAITDNHGALVNEQEEVFVQNHPITGRISRAWKNPKLPLYLMWVAGGTLLIPGFSLFINVLLIIVAIFIYRLPIVMPLKRPASSGDLTDVKSLKAGSENTTTEAKGITCLGYDAKTGYQVWEDSDNDRRHHNILATTGSGKTYGLRFHLLMSIVQTGGLIGIDGKGDIALPLDSVTLFRRFLRDEDVRILNFQQGGENRYEETLTPTTNTFNPLSTGSKSYVSEILKALISPDDQSGGKGGDMWQKRAEAMCDLLAGIATFKRDHGDFKVRASSIAALMEFKSLMQVFVDKDIPSEYKRSLRTYLATLPGGSIEEAEQIANGQEPKEKTIEQHSYVTMQLQPALLVLSETYDYIFDVDIPDIHLKDVVVNNRLLMALLPAMEQSPGTLRNTGKIILAALKGMIAAELGDAFQGNIEELLTERAVSDPSPFRNFFDECGYYAAIPGIEILPAQGRGLGFAFYFIGQTYVDLEKGGKETAAIIWGNANNKQIGKTEDDQTYDKFNKRIGQATIIKREGVDVRVGTLSGTERISNGRLVYAKEDRLKMSDVVKLREGQYYHVVNDSLIEIRTGDPHIPNAVKEARYNQFLPISSIPPKIKKKLRRSFEKFEKFYEQNCNGGRVPPVKADVIPNMSNLLGRHQAVVATTQVSATARIVLWQKVIYDEVQNDADQAIIDAQNQINDILGVNFSGGDEPTAQQEPDHTTSTNSADFDALAYQEEDWTAKIAKATTADPQPVAEPSETEQTSTPGPLADSVPEKEETLDSFVPPEPVATTVSTDGDDDDDWEGERADPLEADREFLRYQLDAGFLDEDEYEQRMAELDLEYMESDDDSSDSDGYELEQSLVNYTRRRRLDDVRMDEAPEPQALPYKQETIDSLKRSGNRRVAEEILDRVSDSFNIDI